MSPEIHGRRRPVRRCHSAGSLQAFDLSILRSLFTILDIAILSAFQMQVLPGQTELLVGARQRFRLVQMDKAKWIGVLFANIRILASYSREVERFFVKS